MKLTPNLKSLARIIKSLDFGDYEMPKTAIVSESMFEDLKELSEGNTTIDFFGLMIRSEPYFPEDAVGFEYEHTIEVYIDEHHLTIMKSEFGSLFLSQFLNAFKK